MDGRTDSHLKRDSFPSLKIEVRSLIKFLDTLLQSLTFLRLPAKNLPFLVILINYLYLHVSVAQEKKIHTPKCSKTVEIFELKF